MTFTKSSGIFFILKTLGLTVLTFTALLLWTPKAHAAEVKMGTITIGYGQPAIAGDNQLYLVDEGMTIEQAINRVGQPVTVEGTINENRIMAVTSIKLYPSGQVLYSNPQVIPQTVIDPTAPTTLSGNLQTHLYSYKPFVTGVTPEVYYGSQNSLQLPLVSYGTRNFEPYSDKTAKIEGWVRPNEFGQWECVVNHIWVDGVEI